MVDLREYFSGVDSETRAKMTMEEMQMDKDLIAMMNDLGVQIIKPRKSEKKITMVKKHKDT